jgi:hypothetical protein
MLVEDLRRGDGRSPKLMEAAARRPVAESGVLDPMLCHGAMAVAHAFHSFPRAALDSTAHALHFHEEGRDLGGFLLLSLPG